MKTYYIYILGSKYHVLYIGITNNLQRRIWEHKNKVIHSFTSKYNIDMLLYFEIHRDIQQALVREKQLKKWSRKKKLLLIKSINPNLKDLSEAFL